MIGTKNAGKVTGSLWKRCSKPHTTQNDSGPIRVEREMGTLTCVHRLKVYFYLSMCHLLWPVRKYSYGVDKVCANFLIQNLPTGCVMTMTVKFLSLYFAQWQQCVKNKVCISCPRYFIFRVRLVT